MLSHRYLTRCDIHGPTPFFYNEIPGVKVLSHNGQDKVFAFSGFSGEYSVKFTRGWQDLWPRLDVLIEAGEYIVKTIS